jgi:hypothetical protein
VRKFCVPIRPDYHRRLFPEIAFGAELPLFPATTFAPMLAHGSVSTPGNTIRKVYLCRAKITRMRPGDMLLFYMSKDESYAASQSITTVGIVEQVANVTAAEELIKQTAKRSVFSAEDLIGMQPSALSPVKMVDFLLVGHSQPSVPLDRLTSAGILTNRPPQSIAELCEERYAALKPLLHLGFDKKAEVASGRDTTTEDLMRTVEGLKIDERRRWIAIAPISELFARRRMCHHRIDATPGQRWQP